MKKLIIYGVSLSLILMGITLYYTGDMVGDSFINTATIVFAVIILVASFGVALKYTNQIKNDKAEGELAPEEWDGIKEYLNRPPKGWMISFILVIVFAFGYFFIGNPTYSFSQIGQYNEEVLAYNKKFEQKFADIKNNKEELHNMGESIYVVQCAICHGVLADGQNGKARDLTTWGSVKHIEGVIANGSTGSMGTMPPGMANGETAKAIANYVSKEFFGNKKVDESLVEAGKAGFAVCASCHGADGNGIASVAPSLRHLVASTLNTGRKGKIGIMPSFKQFSDTEKAALNEYIYNLKNN